MLTAHLPVKKTSYRKLPIKTPPSGEQYYSIQKHKVRIFFLHSLWNKAKLPDTPRSLPTCSCLFQACLYNKSYLPDFFPPLSTTLNSLLSSVINPSLLLYYGILLPLLMFPRTMWFFSLLISAFFSLLHLIPCTLPGFFFL